MNLSGLIMTDMLSFLDKQIKMDSCEDAESIAKQIEAYQNMKVLELRGNTIGVDAGRRLAQALECHPELEKCLWSDLFTGRLKTEIPVILGTLCSAMMNAKCHITELDLSDNAFGPVGAGGISHFLVSPSAYSLQVLKLNNNGLGAGGKTIAKCLIECHRNASKDAAEFKLKTFIAGRNRLEDPGAKALAEAFSVIGSLEEVSIPQNGIRGEGVCALAKSFKLNPCLRVINLNDNTCTIEGALGLAEVLDGLANLEVLDLGDSLCRDDGVIGIWDAISDSKHKNLKYVDFSGNELSAEAAIVIAKQWKEVFLLTGQNVKLKMSNNCFGSQFDDVLDVIEGTPIEIGERDDDEGTLCSEEYDESEIESEEYTDDEEVDADVDDEERAGGGDTSINILLKGIGCMGFESKDKELADDVVSFLDQQLKLNTLQDAEPLVRRIEQQKCMRVLELRGNTLGIKSGERIAQAIKLHPELKRCLWSDMFTGRLKNEIPPILKSLCSAMISANSHITELDLSDNALGPVGAEGIKEFLVSPSAFSLEVLKLNNNGLGGGGKVIADCLLECHRRSVHIGRPLKLKTFVAGRNRLEASGATAFATTFAKIGTLEELVIPQNGITVEGIEALALCFGANPNLRVVNLNDNTATERGSDAIARALPYMFKLEVLNLGDCLCRDQGCHSIVDNLSPTTHNNLKEVDLSGSELSGAAAIQIIEKWRKFSSTTRLNVSSNNFGQTFEVIRKMASGNVAVGDSDEDQGSLSSYGERKSATNSSDEELEEGLDNEDDFHDIDPEVLIKTCRDSLERVQDNFESATQEDAARLLLELAVIVNKGKGNNDVVEMVLDVAQSVLQRVQAVRRRPISTMSQLVNNIVAQAGFVKCEKKWDIPVDNTSLSLLLNRLLARGHLSEQRDVIFKYFGNHA